MIHKDLDEKISALEDDIKRLTITKQNAKTAKDSAETKVEEWKEKYETAETAIPTAKTNVETAETNFPEAWSEAMEDPDLAALVQAVRDKWNEITGNGGQ